MDIKTFQLKNKNGIVVEFCNIGAAITSILVFDKYGKRRDIVLGYANKEDYLDDGACMGKIPGRYANRIAKGKFSINNIEYTLPINNGENHLHGGPLGFANQIWEAGPEKDKVIFTYFSKDGEQGYPGNLTAKAEYSLNDNNELILELYAVTDKPTVVNLTNHTYFNLKGCGNGDILDHHLQLFASYYLPTDKGLIPTGEIASVKNTPMNFTNGKIIRKDISEEFDALIYGKGYDNCWVIDNYQKGKEKLVATLACQESGIKVEIHTTQPTIQVYTGNYLSSSPMGKNEYLFKDYDGVALECQAFVDSPNHKNFPTTLLLPNEEYKQIIRYKFSNL